MCFRDTHSRSKASTKSAKHSILRITSADSHSLPTYPSKDTEHKNKASTTVSPMVDEEADDYSKFLDKAKKDAEEAEKLKLRAIKEAQRRKRDVNMSPWGSRM